MNRNKSDLQKLQKAEADAVMARARAEQKQAQATLVRAQIEASGKRIERNWETGQTKIVAIPGVRNGKVG